MGWPAQSGISVAALLALVALAACHTERDIVPASRHEAGCPGGSSLRLTPRDSNLAAVSASNGAATWAVASNFSLASGGLDLLNSGLGVGHWQHTWRLCLEAPSTIHSFILLFSGMQLPPGSSLQLCSRHAASAAGYGSSSAEWCTHVGAAAPSSQGTTTVAPCPAPTTADEQGGRPCVAVLMYESGAQHSATSPVLQLQAVLLGVQPLAWHRPAAVTATAMGQARGSGGGTTAPTELKSDGQQAAGSQDAALAAALAQVRGSSAADCYIDVACAEDRWQDAADAVVLLLMASPAGGRFCTGALLNTEHLEAAAVGLESSPGGTYILSANHCRSFDTASDAALYYSAVFGYERQSCSPATSPAGSQPAPAIRELMGLSVAWQDEASDVLLLRLDGAVPAEYGAYQLGWNASDWAPPATSPVTISHPRGDLKKLSRSSESLRRAHFWPSGDGSDGSSAGDGSSGRGPTHYQVRWTQGGTDTGSSGAPLMDAGRQQALGVLTGGEAATCHNQDYFGSLRAAWLRGLWTVLSPAGQDAVTAMPGRHPQGRQQGLVVTPSALALLEDVGGRDQRQGQLLVRLVSAPAAGEQLTVGTTVLPAAEAAAGMGQQAAAVALITASPQHLHFDSSNWAQEQQVIVSPGSSDHRVAAPPAPFDVVLQLSSSSGGGSGGDRNDGPGAASWRVVVPGRRVDGNVRTGDTPRQPFLILAAEQLDYAADGVLLVPNAAAALAGTGSDAAAVPGQRFGEVQAGQPLGGLAVAGWPVGSVHFYNLSTSSTVNLSLSVCSPEAPLQVVLFAGGVVGWLSTAPCSAGSAAAGAANTAAQGCLSTSGRYPGECSGMEGVLLPGQGTSPPYTLAVLPLQLPPPPSEARVTAGGAAQASGITASLSCGGGIACSSPAAVHYELHITAHPHLPSFTTVSGL